MNKRILLLLVIALSTSLLLACGGNTQQSADNDVELSASVSESTDAALESTDTSAEDVEMIDEYVHPYRDLAINAEELTTFVSKTEITLDNWEEYFHTEERTDDVAFEYPQTTLDLCVNEGNYVQESLIFTFNFDVDTVSTMTMPGFSPDTITYEKNYTGKEVEVRSFGHGLIQILYMYDKAEDGTTTEITNSISNLQCTDVSGSIYTMTIPEEMWHDIDGEQILFLLEKFDDGNEYVLEYKNTEDDILDLWEHFASRHL